MRTVVLPPTRSRGINYRVPPLSGLDSVILFGELPLASITPDHPVGDHALMRLS